MEKCVDSPTHFSTLPLMENRNHTPTQELPVCQDRCSKVSLKKVEELEVYFSPDARHVFVVLNSGIHSACRQPLSSGRNTREPKQLRRGANHNVEVFSLASSQHKLFSSRSAKLFSLPYELSRST